MHKTRRNAPRVLHFSAFHCSEALGRLKKKMTIAKIQNLQVGRLSFAEPKLRPVYMRVALAREILVSDIGEF